MQTKLLKPICRVSLSNLNEFQAMGGIRHILEDIKPIHKSFIRFPGRWRPEQLPFPVGTHYFSCVVSLEIITVVKLTGDT